LLLKKNKAATVWVIFGSVRFLSKKVTKIKFLKIEKIKPEPNRNRFKPAGFGSIRFFYHKNQKNLYFFWAF